MFASILLLFLLFYVVVPYVFHILCRLKNKDLSKAKKALLVIAHPDDECMFFGPTILGLHQRGVEVKILCLSRGDFYGQGERRENEMINSCMALGVSPDNVTIINDDSLPDHPKIEWSTEKISKLVHSEIIQFHPDVVMSFDEQGVSGHFNHISVCRGIRLLLQTYKAVLKDIKFYELETTNIVMKYCGGVDIFRSYLLHANVFVSTASLYFQTQRAFLCHRSQLVWFRFLYFVFSRYGLVNTLVPVHTES